MLKEKDRLPGLPLILAIWPAPPGYKCITIFIHNWIFIPFDRYFIDKVKSQF